MAPDNNADKRHRNLKCETVIQTEGRRLESYAYNRQDVDVHKQNNADEPVVDPTPMFMGNINKRSQSLHANKIINNNQSFLSEQLTDDDMKMNVKQTKQINNNNDSESFLSDQSRDVDIEAKTKQTNNKTKQKKRKNSKVDNSDRNTHRIKHDKIDIPHEVNSTNQ